MPGAFDFDEPRQNHNEFRPFARRRGAETESEGRSQYLSMTPHSTTAALKSLEAALNDIGPALKQAEPAQYAKAQQLVVALKAGTSRLAEVQALSIDLMKWQLRLQKTRYERQLTALAPLIGQGNPAALASEKALKGAITLLEQALTIAADPARQRSAAEVSSFEKLAKTLEETAASAESAIRRSAAAVRLQPVHAQPTTSSGVTLGVVTPRRKETLAAFKLRPGAIPATAKSAR